MKEGKAALEMAHLHCEEEGVPSYFAKEALDCLRKLHQLGGLDSLQPHC